MKTFKINMVLNHDPVNNLSSTDTHINVKKVIHTNGGHLRIIYSDDSEVVYNASAWHHYTKTVI